MFDCSKDYSIYTNFHMTVRSLKAPKDSYPKDKKVKCCQKVQRTHLSPKYRLKKQRFFMFSLTDLILISILLPLFYLSIKISTEENHRTAVDPPTPKHLCALQDQKTIGKIGDRDKECDSAANATLIIRIDDSISHYNHGQSLQSQIHSLK